MPSLRHNGMADCAYWGGGTDNRVTRNSITKATYGLLAGVRHFRLGCQPATISLAVAAPRDAGDDRGCLALIAAPGATIDFSARVH
jgi:hypothetical protein